MMEKRKTTTIKATQKMGQPITQSAHFAMLELQALEGLADLIKRSPKAAELIVLLVRRLERGSGGVIVCSRQTMRELLGCSMPTAERALRLLIEEGWVHRIRIGGVSALAINHRVAWVGPRGDIQHAVFGATVIASRNEQDSLSLNPPPMKNIPIIENDEEEVLPIGSGLNPPSQEGLAGFHPTVKRKGKASTKEGIYGGNSQLEQAELEALGQKRLDV